MLLQSDIPQSPQSEKLFADKTAVQRKMFRLILPLFLGIFSSGCSNTIEEVSGEQFQWYYENARMETMHSGRYLGENDGKVYIERKSMPMLGGEWKVKLLYADKSELDPKFLSDLPPLQFRVSVTD